MGHHTIVNDVVTPHIKLSKGQQNIQAKCDGQKQQLTQNPFANLSGL